MAREIKVQTPGAAPEATTSQETAQVDATEVQAEVKETREPVAAGAGPSLEELQAQIAALEADKQRLIDENVKLAAIDPEANRKAVAEADAAFDRADKSISRASREQYLSMRAHQVDAKTLVAAVLTKDGWVAPDQSGQKAKG